MKQGLFLSAVFGALMAACYLRELLGRAFLVVALLFVGSLGSAALQYLDLRRQSRREGLKDE